MTSHFFIVGFCVLWILLCGRMWWVIGREHIWQRRLVAIGAGLGAALFYVLATTILDSVKKEPAPQTVPSGEEVRINLPAP